MAFTTAERTVLGRRMAAAITDKVRNPNEWNATARGTAERLGLNLVRVEFHAAIVSEAEKQEVPYDVVRTAVEAL
jgi:hypothetical protein